MLPAVDMWKDFCPQIAGLFAASALERRCLQV
jgi:hypothetical protein